MGDQVASRDGLGCTSHALAKDLELCRSDVRLYRKAVVSDGVSEVLLPASDRGFLIGVSASRHHKRRIYRGRSMSDYDFAEGSIYLRNFADDYRAEMVGSFDFLLFEVTGAQLRQVAEEVRSPSIGGLVEHAAHDDPVLSNLVRAMAPAMERPQEVHGLFIDQLSMAICMHLLHRYGADVPSTGNRSIPLSKRLEIYAKEFLEANLHRDVSLDELADACSLSRGYLIRAFRETTGMTPYRWLIARRVERARQLIEQTELPLAEIAATCGFADQSHLSRHCVQLLGHSPGRLRRHARG
ncbi:AraC family transcriptional regulator [Rhizobium sp. SL86]|uniref:AraC family transcriptional regulator n=1 Tax=Rhizobium sp. SL86 TaxID=2995148 RepID=UPI0022769E84|nr:AraC family transcriptional regulator [Rhizobium sp. SL86]MCY1666464.1 AraC family transcriptional regulator [Rhizobium sp. SL86]